jgi:hypothetical protein
MTRNRCAICDADRETRTMETACGAEEARAPSVCRDRLAQRDARRWSADGAEGRRLRDALASREHEHPQGRYAYLVDRGEAIHLVRLEHGWLERHAAPV